MVTLLPWAFPAFILPSYPWWLRSDSKMVMVTPHHICARRQIQWGLPAPMFLASKWLWFYSPASEPILDPGWPHPMSQHLVTVHTPSCRCWRQCLNCSHALPPSSWRSVFLPGFIFLSSTYDLIMQHILCYLLLQWIVCLSLFPRVSIFACLVSISFVQGM